MTPLTEPRLPVAVDGQSIDHDAKRVACCASKRLNQQREGEGKPNQPSNQSIHNLTERFRAKERDPKCINVSSIMTTTNYSLTHSLTPGRKIGMGRKGLTGWNEPIPKRVLMDGWMDWNAWNGD